MFKMILKAPVAALILASAAAHAAPVVFDRGLPTANLNDSFGASRSNVAWGSNQATPPKYTGDDFTLAAGTWNISTVRVWAVIGLTSNNSASLIADRYSSISLYGGGAGNSLTNLMSGNTTGNTTDNANITIKKVQYAGGENYESFGNLLNIFEIDFNNLNWTVTGGELQNFSVAGLDNTAETTFRPFFMHASNAAAGVAPADGADNLFKEFVQNGANLDFVSTVNSNGNGWDKSSDINVQIEANAVPEPASMALFGVAMAGFGLARRQRRIKG